MPSVWQAELDGIGPWQQRLKDPDTLARPVRRYLKLVTEDAFKRVQANLRPHSNTGRSAISVHRTIDGRTIPQWGEVGSSYYVLRMLEGGTEPHFPRVDGTLKQWAESRGLDPYAVARSIARKGTRRRSIFNRARFATRRKVPEFAEQAGREIVQQVSGGPVGL